MKKNKLKYTLCLIGFFVLAFAHAQTPYDAFAPEQSKKEMLKNEEVKYIIYNTDTSSNIKYIEYEAEEQKLKIYTTGDSLSSSFLFNPLEKKWWSIDALHEKYPYASPYNFVLNTPMRAIDPNGEDVYFVIYTGGSDDALGAAETRIDEIEKSKGFDPRRDKVVYLKVYDLGKLEARVERAVQKYSNKYGKTIEASFYGHGAGDGPVGAEVTSKNNLADVTGNWGALYGDQKQLSPVGWRNINFNFDPDQSIAGFYGCNTDEFAQKMLYYQDVQYTTGTQGESGGSYTYKDDFSAVWINIWNSNVYQVSQEKGKVLPRYVYSLDQPVKTFQYDTGEKETLEVGDAHGTFPQRNSNIQVYGNITVNDKGKPVSGSK